MKNKIQDMYNLCLFITLLFGVPAKKNMTKQNQDENYNTEYFK